MRKEKKRKKIRYDAKSFFSISPFRMEININRQSDYRFIFDEFFLVTILYTYSFLFLCLCVDEGEQFQKWKKKNTQINPVYVTTHSYTLSVTHIGFDACSCFGFCALHLLPAVCECLVRFVHLNPEMCVCKCEYGIFGQEWRNVHAAKENTHTHRNAHDRMRKKRQNWVRKP